MTSCSAKQHQSSLNTTEHVCLSMCNFSPATGALPGRSTRRCCIRAHSYLGLPTPAATRRLQTAAGRRFASSAWCHRQWSFSRANPFYSRVPLIFANPPSLREDTKPVALANEMFPARCQACISHHGSLHVDTRLILQETPLRFPFHPNILVCLSSSNSGHSVVTGREPVDFGASDRTLFLRFLRKLLRAGHRHLHSFQVAQIHLKS